MASNKRVKRWHESRENMARDLLERAEEWRYLADDLAEVLYLVTEEPNEDHRRRANDAISAYERARRR